MFPYRTPTKQNWESLRPEIAALLEQGWGCSRLAKRYKVSVACVHQNLKKLGLRTKYQMPVKAPA